MRRLGVEPLTEWDRRPKLLGLALIASWIGLAIFTAMFAKGYWVA